MKKSETRSIAAERRLVFQAVIRVVLVFLLTGFILFATAGSLKYWRGWLFLALLFTPMIFTLTYLAARDPELLEKRMRIREKERAQKVYIRVSFILVIIAFMIPGFDFRFNLSEVPVSVTIISSAMVELGYALFVYVLMVNRFASRTIELQVDQKLVDTGPYSLIRHPMYSAALIIYGAAPLVLGSYYALIPMGALPFVLSYRIKNEEMVLISGLKGYREYMRRVRYRLIPYVW